jgi:tetratricopeptide (TPR) repeat protein
MEILHEAVALHQQGRVEEAQARYRQVLDAEPDNPYALNFSGAAHASLGDLEAAVQALERCVRVAPEYPDAHANLGIAYRASGRLEEALRAQERVVALTPRDAAALNEMGITLRRLGRYEAALEAYRRAIEAVPGGPDAHANAGNVLQDLDRMEEAVDSYARAIVLGADTASVHRERGTALQRLNRLEEAEAAYRSALAREPDFVPALTDLGGVLVELGRADQGVEYLRRSANLAPDVAMVHSNLGMALHESGDLTGAVEAFERALALDPGNTHALAYQTIVLHQLGERQRFDELVGLRSLVRELELPVPPRYPDRAALNEDLARFARSHPSVFSGRRRGISSELFLSADGPPLALRESIREAVEAYIGELPSASTHPFVARKPSRFVLSGWCNVLDEGAAAHVHPNAWLSGVYYVRTEGIVGDGVDDPGGCLRVGAPDAKHYPAADYPVRVFRPLEGHLVVFPSYVWHQILPFRGRGQRISYAFDVVPE